MPDPINVVQTPLQIAIIAQIMQRLRGGKLDSIPKKYNNVIFVSHSYGSIVGRLIATFLPTSGADAYVLTSTAAVLKGLPNLIPDFHPQAASTAYPALYGNLAPGYQAVSPASVRDVLYSLNGQFEPKLVAFDQTVPKVFAMGQIATPSGSTKSNFTGPVLVLTGREDQIVCGNANITSQIPDCGVGSTSYPAQMHQLFPRASRVDTYITDKTGHNINLHYSAPESFGAAHEWMQNMGF
jgi:pimeloyl-ACP methyl ester carboxylesterase